MRFVHLVEQGHVMQNVAVEQVLQQRPGHYACEADHTPHKALKETRTKQRPSGQGKPDERQDKEVR